MIKQASKEEAEILAQMAIKIWNNDSVEELEQEFNEFAVNSDMTSFIKYVDKKPVGFANASIRYDYVEGCETSPVGFSEANRIICFKKDI